MADDNPPEGYMRDPLDLGELRFLAAVFAMHAAVSRDGLDTKRPKTEPGVARRAQDNADLADRCFEVADAMVAKI